MITNKVHLMSNELSAVRRDGRLPLGQGLALYFSTHLTTGAVHFDHLLSSNCGGLANANVDVRLFKIGFERVQSSRGGDVGGDGPLLVDGTVEQRHQYLGPENLEELEGLAEPVDQWERAEANLGCRRDHDVHLALRSERAVRRRMAPRTSSTGARSRNKPREERNGQKGLRLQFNSRQSSTVDTSILPFSARHFESSTKYSTYIPCRQIATGLEQKSAGRQVGEAVGTAQQGR
eukprot:1186474-Prorocentrum_minimum.AAC.1